MTETTTAAPRLLHPRDVARLLSIGLRTVYDLVYSGELEQHRIGKPGSKNPALRISAESVEAFIARSRVSR